MNIIDIVIIICFALSVILGFKDGVIRQLGALVGIVAAIFFAKNFGDQLSTILNITGDNAHIWGFIIVFVLAMIAVAALSSLLRRFVSAVGLGVLDRVAGGLLGAIECILILSVAILIFDFFNSSVQLIEEEKLSSSKLYQPVMSVSAYILPTIKWVGDQLPTEK